MLAELLTLRARAMHQIAHAIERLADPQDVSSALWDHFRTRPDDRGGLRVIRRVLDRMQLSMFDPVIFVCRDVGDQPCRASGGSRTARRRMVTSRPYIQACGDYVGATSGWDFLGQFERGVALRTLIHEYAHFALPSTILPAGTEFYRERSGSGYPRAPELARRNADCYAWFAMSV